MSCLAPLKPIEGDAECTLGTLYVLFVSSTSSYWKGCTFHICLKWKIMDFQLDLIFYRTTMDGHLQDIQQIDTFVDVVVACHCGNFH